MRQLKLFIRLAAVVAATAFALRLPCAAEAQTLSLPATGVWNGFNSQLNTLECSNGGDVGYGFVVTVKSSQGQVLGTQTVNLLPQGTAHLVLNGFGLENSYGTYALTHLSGDAQGDSPLNCATIIYRFPSGAATKAIDYAYALPVRNSLRGGASGIYNSMNPSGWQPIENWLTIYNPGSQPFSASVAIYDRDGAEVPGAGFFLNALQPGERRDFAVGHPAGQQIGLYRISPADPSAPYGAFLTRYSRDGERFNFAFPVLALPGESDPGAVAASTMDPAINWGEIANAGDSSVTVEISIRDGFGASKHREAVVIPARGQYHVSVNTHLGERSVGTISAKVVSSGGRILLQSAYYGYRSAASPGIEWAYVSQAEGLSAFEGDRISFLVNTFFDAANWGKFLDASGAPSTVNQALFDGGGNSKSRVSKPIFANGNIDIGLHEQAGSGFTGQALAYASIESAELGAELLRVFPDSRGGIGSVLRVPPRIIPAAAAQRGAVRVANEGHYFQFRSQKIAIVGDSISQAWMELGPDFKSSLYIDNIALNGVNALMIWAYIGIEDQRQDSRIGYIAPRRWPWQEVSGAFFPPYWFDFIDSSFRAKFNEAYFQALTALVKEANERNLLVLITVHDGWTKERFNGHPMNVANAGFLTDRSQYVNLGDYSNEMPEVFDPAWTPAQKHQFLLERFTDRLIRATADYPNVLYEMFNEGEWYNQANLLSFQRHFLDFFKARTDLPLVVNNGGDAIRQDATVDAIALHQPNWSSSTHATSPFNHYSSRYTSGNPLSKPFLFDEPVPEYRKGSSINGIMRLMWGTILGGSGFFVANDSAWDFNYTSIDPVFPITGYAARFMNENGIRFWEMAPDADISSSDVCLAKRGTEYLAYIESTNVNFTIDLSDAVGTFEVRFFSPRAGTYFPTISTVSGGGVRSLVKPSIDDWVTWIKRTA